MALLLTSSVALLLSEYTLKRSQMFVLRKKTTLCYEMLMLMNSYFIILLFSYSIIAAASLGISSVKIQNEIYFTDLLSSIIKQRGVFFFKKKSM